MPRNCGACLLVHLIKWGLYRWFAHWWSSYGDLHVHPLAAKKTLAKYKMVGLGRNNNFTTIRLLDYIIYACRATVAGLGPAEIKVCDRRLHR